MLELNACPGLRMHLAPTEGEARDVAAAVVDSMYPPGVTARIPVLSITGTNGKTTTARMIGHLLRQAGLRVGLACTDGVFVGGELIYAADASGPRSAEMVLDDLSVEAAVLETARGGIVRRGLGYDQADVAVVTNITADHLGDDGIDSLEELVYVKALVAEEIRDGGSVVLNADDPLTAGLASRPAVLARAPVIRYFSLTAGNEVVARHKAAGGACYEVIDGALTETEGGEQRTLLAARDLPGAVGGRAAHVVANALAAVAAARAAGVSVPDICDALKTFCPPTDNPGRGNVFRSGSSPVIVDYGHNAAALHATGRFIRDAWGGAPVAAVTLPGDRRDDLLIQTAEAIAAWFGTVVLYEDSDKRGRPAGQMQELIGSALRSARPGIRCSAAENPADALRAAVELAAGSPVLFVYEKLPLALDALTAVGASPWPEADRAVPGAAAAAEAAAADAAAVADAAAAVVADAAAAVGAGADGRVASTAPEVAGTGATDPAAIVITDAADAALAQARASSTARPHRGDGSADYAPAAG